MNVFGDRFSLELFGESHTPELGVIIRGIPASFNLESVDFASDLARRKSGAKGTTMRIEEDSPIVLDHRKESGTVIISFRNGNTRSDDYSKFNDIPRPGHADFTSKVKYGEAKSGGGIFSGRMTLPLVAAGAIAKKMIEPMSVRAFLVEVGGIPFDDSEGVYKALDQATAEGDSIGALAQCVCENVPAGLGDPFFGSVESQLSSAIFSIPGIRGIEFGDGFKVTHMRGSEHNDCFIDACGHTSTNGAGGINGGITNGNPLVFRVAIKPTSSISRPQETFDFASGKITTLQVRGRHDVCFGLRVPPVIEAVTAIVLFNLNTI